MTVVARDGPRNAERGPTVDRAEDAEIGLARDGGHPAYILRLTGGEVEATKRLVWADLKALRTRLDAPDVPPTAEEPPEQPGLFGP